MKKIVFSLLFAIGFTGLSFAQESYDKALAEKLGADDYGMKKYVMAFLLRGDRVSEYTPEQRQEIQAGHMANIGKMADMGKLIVAGPFFGNDDLRGIYIFDVQSIEEAKTLTETDPAIQAGVLKMDLKEWYGSAALMLLPELYPKVTKRSF
ncbi:YciI family protein [Algoriphagus mannitolivorans]|uniref:YciI family protein n=1 Tax=Algoriphagus mannitolivorans TaxID=226504 RepID=UPI00040100DE|nr:YciI family protein [Algoriphagus mannitolivorans]